jgi:hypothetical protein
MKNPKWTTEIMIELLTPNELKAVPDGTILFDIFGMPCIAGRDHADDDTRWGYTAFGYLLVDGTRFTKVIP